MDPEDPETGDVAVPALGLLEEVHHEPPVTCPRAKLYPRPVSGHGADVPGLFGFGVGAELHADGGVLTSLHHQLGLEGPGQGLVDILRLPPPGRGNGGPGLAAGGLVVNSYLDCTEQ